MSFCWDGPLPPGWHHSCPIAGGWSQSPWRCLARVAQGLGGFGELQRVHDVLIWLVNRCGSSLRNVLLIFSFGVSNCSVLGVRRSMFSLGVQRLGRRDVVAKVPAVAWVSPERIVSHDRRAFLRRWCSRPG